VFNNLANLDKSHTWTKIKEDLGPYFDSKVAFNTALSPHV